MCKFMNVARIASGALLSGGESTGASSALSDFMSKYITPMANDMGTALIAVVGAILAAMVGFLAVKYGLPIALQWIRKMTKQ